MNVLLEGIDVVNPPPQTSGCSKVIGICNGRFMSIKREDLNLVTLESKLKLLGNSESFISVRSRILLGINIIKVIIFFHQSDKVLAIFKSCDIFLDSQNNPFVDETYLHREIIPDPPVHENDFRKMHYGPPEVLNLEPFSKQSDSYYFGVIFYEIITGNSAFNHWSWNEVICKVVYENKSPEFPSNIFPKELVFVLSRCFEEKSKRALPKELYYDLSRIFKPIIRSDWSRSREEVQIGSCNLRFGEC